MYDVFELSASVGPRLEALSQYELGDANEFPLSDDGGDDGADLS